jgi:hypothetical protein
MDEEQQELFSLDQKDITTMSIGELENYVKKLQLATSRMGAKKALKASAKTATKKKERVDLNAILDSL